MPECMQCREDYEIPKSGPMIQVCPSCFSKPREPEEPKYIKHGKILMPNPNFEDGAETN